MRQDWVQPGPQNLVEVTTYFERHGCNSPILSEAVGIAVVSIFFLAWETICPSAAPILLFGLLAVSYINYLLGRRDVLYPAFIYTAIWALVAAAYNFCPIKIDPIGWKTVALLLAGAVSFSVGSSFGNRSLIRSKLGDRGDMEGTKIHDNSQARNALLGCTLLITLLFLIVIIRIAGGIFSLNLQFLLKLNLPGSPLEGADAFTNTVVTSAGLLPVLTLWVLLMEEKRRWKVAICAICVGLFPLFVTQRGLVMVAFCGCLTLFLLKRRDRSFRKMAKPLGFAASGIITLMALMSLTKDWAQSPGGFSATDAMWMYIAGPVATLDYALYHPEFFKGQPNAVFAQVLTPLSRMGLIRYRSQMEVDGSKLDRFVFVPFPGNVYTAYKPYYQDFGVIGCLAAFTLFGFIEGHLFYSAIRGSRYAVFFFTYLSGPMMFSTFDDSFHAFSRHLNIIVFAIGYFWILKRIRVRL